MDPRVNLDAVEKTNSFGLSWVSQKVLLELRSGKGVQKSVDQIQLASNPRPLVQKSSALTLDNQVTLKFI